MSRRVIGTFDDGREARLARDELLAAGLGPEHIHVTGAEGEGLWHRIRHALHRGERVVLSADVHEADADRVLAVLNRHHAVDVEQEREGLRTSDLVRPRGSNLERARNPDAGAVVPGPGPGGGRRMTPGIHGVDQQVPTAGARPGPEGAYAPDRGDAAGIIGDDERDRGAQPTSATPSDAGERHRALERILEALRHTRDRSRPH